MIAIRNLVKQFDGQTVLNGLSLEVRQGEVAAIVGPSGGGKSTLLRCVIGLDDFQAGSVSVAAVEITPQLAPRERQRRLAAVRRHVGMVFQQFNLFPHLNVLENVIEAPIHVLHKRREEAEAEAVRLLERVGLADKLRAMPDKLSGGQQQRVAIARALAMGPEVMLFDEPTSALDPRMAAEVEAVIADLAASGQKTMLLVTHSLPLARRSAHTVHVADGGQIVESGPPAAVFEAPREPTTRRFLAEVTRG